MKPELPELPFDPFAARAVGDPWRSPEPDVANINARPFRGILKLLGQIGKTQQAAALVLGEAGSGKTHLIKRLMSEQDLRLIFVYIHPMRDGCTMFSNLMERVLTNLDCPPPGSQGPQAVTQLDNIVANIIVAAMDDYRRVRPDNVKIPSKTWDTITKDPAYIFKYKGKSDTWHNVIKKTGEFLARKIPKDRISKMVLKCLFQYLDKAKRDAVRLFLSGYVPDEDDAKMLGLTFAEIDHTVAAQEDRSKNILKAIGRLLGFYRPMILCFDQLENLDSPSLVNAFGRLVSEIVNETENILPVSFMRPDTLESRFASGECDKAALDRLKSNIFVLEGCNVDQALEMVKVRLAWAFDGCPTPVPHQLYPFQEGRLRSEILKDGNTPRQILTRASKMVGTAFEPEDPLDIVQQCFAAEREKLLAGGRPEPFSKQTVLEAILLYFQNRSEDLPYRVTEIQTDTGVDLHLQIARSGMEAQTLYLDLQVETATHGRTLIRILNNLMQRMNSGNADLSFFVRDACSPIPPGPGKMPMTAQTLQAFQNTVGGTRIYLEYVRLVDLYALVYTRNKIPPGDLSYVANPSGERQTVEMVTLQTFLKEHFRSPFLEELVERALTLPVTVAGRQSKMTKNQREKVIAEVKKILDRPPFMFKLEQIATSLRKSIPDIEVTLDQLATAINQHSREIVQMAVTPPIYHLKR